ncbi:hypothetical protein NMG60_11019684 [Bertholletia excelsa]
MSAAMLSRRKVLRKSSSLLSFWNNSYEPNQDEMKRVFDKFDSDKDGKISPDDYRAMLVALKKGNMLKYVAQIFEVADLDRDGFIDFKEFIDVHRRDGGVKAADIKSAFRTIDSDKNGKITAEEVFELLKRLGEECSLPECRRMVRAVDANGDGVVDLDDFVYMMTKTMKPA